MEVEGDGAGGRAFVEVFEEEAVAVVIGVLVDLDGGIGVGGRDADAPGFETAEAGGEERERVGLAGGETGEFESGGAVGEGSAVEEFLGELTASGVGGEVIGSGAAAVVSEAGGGAGEGPVGAAGDAGAGEVEDDPVDGVDGGGAVEADFVSVGTVGGERAICVGRPAERGPDPAGGDFGAVHVEGVVAEGEGGAAFGP